MSFPPLQRRFRLWIAPAILLSCTFLIHCSSSGLSDDGSGSGGAASGGSTGSGSRKNVDIDVPYGGGGGDLPSSELDPLCGTGTCIPDDAADCELDVPASMGGTAGGGGGLGGLGGLGGDASVWSGVAGLSSNPGDLDAVTAGCLVSSAGERSCSIAGAKTEGEPCLAATDCAASLACVGTGESGVCRRYCCRGTEASCGPTTYCAPRPMVGEPAVQLPVCVPVDNCSLLEPHPCPAGQECSCAGELACIVVRSDGKTACAVPGPLRAGDPCDPNLAGQCSAGLVCSGELGCLQICSTQDEPSGCPAEQLCQAPAGFPLGLGVCVGGGLTPDVAP